VRGVAVVLVVWAVAGCRIGYEEDGQDGGDGNGPSLYADEVLADGPIAYWRFGEEVTPVAVDASGNGHEGTYAAVTLGHEGAIAGDPDTAVRIAASSDSGVAFGNGFAFAGDQPFSAELWVKPEREDACLMGQADYDDEGQRYLGWFFYFQDASVTLRRAGIGVTAPGDLSMSEWTHLVATFDGVTLSLYRDGELANQRVTSSDLVQGAQPFLVGRMTNWQSYEGLIDEVALYDYALPPARIAAHHAAATGSD
jgi:hypothetical protein